MNKPSINLQAWRLARTSEILHLEVWEIASQHPNTEPFVFAISLSLYIYVHNMHHYFLRVCAQQVQSFTPTFEYVTFSCVSPQRFLFPPWLVSSWKHQTLVPNRAAWDGISGVSIFRYFQDFHLVPALKWVVVGRPAGHDIRNLWSRSKALDTL